MGNGFKETAFNNTDEKKFKENHAKIFGKREKLECVECELSSRQKLNDHWKCPHCGAINKYYG